MQPSLSLKLTAAQQELVKKQPDQAVSLLPVIIAANADQIGYLLQAYYPREKVSRVDIVSDSIDFNDAAYVALKLSYVLEEFSACSAVDTEDKVEMPVTVGIDPEDGLLTLTGEYWPERD